ncbi:MAG: tetratricopeptide repeat protein, partial [Planctomycetes bacterium]|nr:tetratricopeptide repeat protein [Planctomycetota bacterium]
LILSAAGFAAGVALAVLVARSWGGAAGGAPTRSGGGFDPLADAPDEIRRDPDFIAGERALEEGRYGDALDRFDAVAIRHPHRAEALWRIAEIFIRGRYLESAQTTAEIAVLRAPESGSSHFWLGRVWEAWGDLERAEKEYIRAAELDDRDPRPLYHLGGLADEKEQFSVSARYYRQALERDPACAPAAHYLAIQERGAGRFDEAVRLLEAALERDPEHQNLRFNLAQTLLRMGEVEASVREFRRALKAPTDQAEPYFYLGRGLELLGRPAEAIEAWRGALRRDPHLASAWYALAQLLERQGRAEEAAKARERFEEARELASRVSRIESHLETSPRDVEALVELGRLHLEKGKPYQAFESLNRAREIDPEHAAARALFERALGEIRAREGAGEEASASGSE